MHLLLAAVLGVLAGAWVRAAVFRLSVPDGAAWRTACPRCGYPLRPTFACRCPSCRSRAALPCGTTEITTAFVLGVIVFVIGPHPEAVAFGALAVLCVALATIDHLVYRLPDPLTLPAYPVLAALFAFAALLDGEPGRLLRVLLTGLVLWVVYLVLALIRPGELGRGDIKLAGLLGMALGWYGWQAALVANALAFVLCGAAGLVLLIAGRAGLKSSLPLGPFMVYGTFVTLLVTPG